MGASGEAGMADWLTDFVAHTSYGEAPERVMYWCGVSAIAGALRRKVWLDMFNFQWTPNFYILLIGPPGQLKKSTSSGLAMRILKRIEGTKFGPNSTTWEQLISHMSGLCEDFDVPGVGTMQASCITCDISEFGTFFDPSNRQMVDALTDLWDSKVGVWSKETKTNGCDDVVNPWINLIAGTTHDWMDANFSKQLIGSGFASRCIYVSCTEDEIKEVPYPDESMPPGMQAREDELKLRLEQIAGLAGKFTLTKAAREYGKAWYHEYRIGLKQAQKKEKGLYARSQTHLHKLAMVISASKGLFPVIDVAELQEADAKLRELGGNVDEVFGSVGQGAVSKLAMEIVECLVKAGATRKWALFDKKFYRRVSDKDFESALKSAVLAGRVKEVGDMRDPLLELV